MPAAGITWNVSSPSKPIAVTVAMLVSSGTVFSGVCCRPTPCTVRAPWSISNRSRAAVPWTDHLIGVAAAAAIDGEGIGRSGDVGKVEHRVEAGVLEGAGLGPVGV